MLSIKNPPSETDPTIPCQLKKKKLSNSPHLDPSSSSTLSSLDHHHHPHHQTPNFCIRDYVFAVRKKDVKKNWPFSSENLQLCLSHGVKQPLPPFQSLGAAKIHSPNPCTYKTASDVVKNSDDLPTTQKKAVDPRKFEPSSENAFALTETSAHQSGIECTEAEQPASDQSTVKMRNKSENTTRSTSKKCRLVVRLGASSAEDAAPNTMAASELMASSKTCPVCKTFSSSSNTTLNAHIDQCLASCSKPVSGPSSRAIKHKIKPRKIRLMTDVYTTAKECTLEELDRRNGTSRAVIGLNSSGLDSERSRNVEEQGKRQRASSWSDRSKDCAGKQANVYVDANGTKVRILSKLDDDDETMVKKHAKGSKGRKLSSVEKKSRHGKTRHKHLKRVSQCTKLLRKRACSSDQVSADPEGYSREENEERRRTPKAVKLVSFQGSSKPWTPLRFTSVTKESNKKGCTRNPSSEIHEQCPRDSPERRDPKRPSLPMKRNSSSVGGAVMKPHENDGARILRLRREMMSSSVGLRKSVMKSRQFESKTLKAGKDTSRSSTCARKTRFGFKPTRPCDLDDDDDDDLMQNGLESRLMGLDDSSFGTPEPVLNEEQLASESPKGETDDSSPRLLESYDDDDDDDDDETSSSSDSAVESDKKVVDDDDDNDDDDDVLKDIDSHGITEERAVTNLSRFLGTEYIRRTPSKTPLNSSLDDSLLRSSEHDFLGREEDYSAREDTSCMADLDGKADRGSFFPEVEPIPIPGPPGSFLPSPRDMMMASDEFPGHSSLTTSPVRSPDEDHRDFIERVSSDSPLSIVSTVSNSRPDHMIFFGLGQDKNLDSAVSSEKLEFNGFGVGFRYDEKPCCCQTKETSLSSTFQESQLLKRRTMASADRQSSFLLNTCFNSSDLQRSGKPPITRPLSDIDCNTTSPSGSNPILRLMGKNLMVVNTDEETCTPLGHGGFMTKPRVLPAATPLGSDMLDHGPYGNRNYVGGNLNSWVPQNHGQATAGTLQSHYYGAPMFSRLNPESGDHPQENHRNSSLF